MYILSRTPNFRIYLFHRYFVNKFTQPHIFTFFMKVKKIIMSQINAIALSRSDIDIDVAST